MAVLRTNHVQIWWPSTTVLQHWCVRQEQLMSSTWICAKHLTLSDMIALSLNLRDMDLMDGPLGGSGIVWMITLKELRSTIQCHASTHSSN